jgi:type IV pilus biogenesis protein CpaD/CtpE
MMRALALTSTLLATLALVGCVGTADPPHAIPENPNPITSKKVDYPFELRFGGTVITPSADEIGRLQNFLQTTSARPGDKVTVSSENTALGQSRRTRVTEILANAGLAPISGVDLRVGPNAVSLVLQETVAVAPDCGEWPIYAGDQPQNAPSLNLGCALHSNLYQMVVDKRDLVVGRTPGPADAEPFMRAVQTYREGKSPIDSSGGAAAGGGGGGTPAGSAAIAAATGAASLANIGGGGASNGQ